MSDNLARCRRCHDVFDPEAGVCPRCGTPWQPIAAPPTPEEGSFADRYAGTTLVDPSLTPHEVEPHANLKTVAVLIGAGAGLLTLAAVLGLLFSMGVFSPAATKPPVIVSLAPPTKPAPSPTTQPDIAHALTALNNPKLNAHVVVQNRVQEDSIITGHAMALTVSIDCSLANGEEMAIVNSGSLSQEIRYVDGTFFVRRLPGGKWAPMGGVSSWVMLLPLFDIKSAKMLELIDSEPLDGQPARHLRATKWWVPDLNRLGMMDAAITTLGLKPDTTVLDIWISPSGKLMFASFSGTSTSKDGRKLLDIETTWTFSDVGAQEAIVNPLASPTPVPSTSAGASPVKSPAKSGK